VAVLISKKFVYKNSIEWEEQKKGILYSDGKPGFKVSSPPEFKGHAGIWNPEELFIASVNSCIMTTFLYYAERKNLEFISYKSEAEGTIELVENKFVFTEIKIRPFIIIKNSSDIEKAKELIEFSEKNCLISNSIKPKVSVIALINTNLEMS